MRSVAVFGHTIGGGSQLLTTETVQLDGIDVTFGLLSQDEPHFDSEAPEHANNVLIRVRAFSCNFRDKALIFLASQRCPAHSYYVLGSDFVGEVLAIGSAVSKFGVGDRVIGNSNWSGSKDKTVPDGVPTNHGSREHQLFHQEKLVKIPESMPTEVAAAFGIGAQTVYSMVRKLDLQPAATVLVTAAKSNTSLFAIQALRKFDVNVYATSTSKALENELKMLGVKRLLEIAPQKHDFASLHDLILEIGKFHAVIDPFSDLHLEGTLPLIANGGSYITCGLHDQYSRLIGEEPEGREINFKEVMTRVMIENIRLIGNCLGVTKDLENALHDYASDRFDICLDSVFSDGQIGEFFTRTYNSRNRFGKVVYRYD